MKGSADAGESGRLRASERCPSSAPKKTRITLQAISSVRGLEGSPDSRVTSLLGSAGAAEGLLARQVRPRTAEGSAPEAEVAPKFEKIQPDDTPLDATRCLFCEFFAGTAVLTAAAVAAGVPARQPDDLAHGGTDFSQKGEVRILRDELLSLHKAESSL